MSSTDLKAQIKALDKRMIIVNIVDFPAMALVALGLFGKFSDNPGDLHPLLADSNVTTGMLIAGGIIAVWCASEMLSIVRRRGELQRKLQE